MKMDFTYAEFAVTQVYFFMCLVCLVFAKLLGKQPIYKVVFIFIAFMFLAASIWEIINL